MKVYFSHRAKDIGFQGKWIWTLVYYAGEYGRRIHRYTKKDA